MEVLKGPPLRVNFENAIRQLFFKLRPQQKQGKGVQKGSGITQQHLFQIDPLPWTLNFLSAYTSVPDSVVAPGLHWAN